MEYSWFETCYSFLQFPLKFSGLTLGIAFDRNVINTAAKIIITDQSGTEVGFVSIGLKTTDPDTKDLILKNDGPVLLVPEHGWTTAFFPVVSDILISKPGIYYLKVEVDDSREIIGEIQFVLVTPPPLTQERIAAIKSDPSAGKIIRIEVGCRKCPDKLMAYAGLERSPELEVKGYCLCSNIPDQFTCGCGNTNIDLKTIRQNLHGLLGQRMREGLEVGFVPLYEKDTLEDIRNKFIKLLNLNPKEELLQQFIEENPILLHQFPAEQLFFKPPILTFFKADFGIVTPQKELVLVEIEKTTTQLLKKDGGLHSSLTHAFDQVRDWLHTVDDHRLAVLDSMEIDRGQVSTVKGVVIAGRDSDYNAKHLHKLKGNDWGRIVFLTYDDLLFALDALSRKLKQF